MYLVPDHHHRQAPHLSLGLLHKIVVEAAAAHTLEDQIDRLVREVSKALSVDVCSLFQVRPDGSLRMVANTGLTQTVWSTIELRPGEGLVGLIARTQLPLNLQIAQQHPAYHYFPGSGEENFQAFLGVPIVHLGSVIGVLVVQDQDQRGFTADEESFLVTMAAQLSGSMLRLPLAAGPDQPATRSERTIRGVSAAPGQALGRVQLLIGDQTLNLLDEPASQGISPELKRFAEALKHTQAEIQAGKSRFDETLSNDVLGIFDFYNQLLDSDHLTSEVEASIRENNSAFSAVRKFFDESIAAFDTIEDEYIRLRASDIRNIGNKLLAAVLGQTPDATSSEQGLVLLGEDISVTDIARFDPAQLAAIVCLEGSSLSHSILLARALGIPAVVATGPIDHIKSIDTVIVDGDLGLVVLSPLPQTSMAYTATIEAARSFDEALLADIDLPAETKDGFRVRLYANTGLMADISPGIQRGAEGIGLYRSEIPFLAQEAFPTETEQYQVYREILAAYYPRPVIMRTLDIGSDKKLPYLTVTENNPALGWRGIRFSMLPMISTSSETREANTLLDTVIEQLQSEGAAVAKPPLGIMVEVPGVVTLLQHQRQWIDFISVGTNDLTQYLLAVDRTNPRVSALYDHMHPAVVRTLNDILQVAQKLQLEVSVCGEMAGDPYAVVLLLGMGYPSLSMNAFSIPRIKALIRSLTSADAKRCLADVLVLHEPDEIRERVRTTLAATGLDKLVDRHTQHSIVVDDPPQDYNR
jgi:phosphotransferase system enzyme I (PtsI)/phosphotransferase system enzyme I (PtsP)